MRKWTRYFILSVLITVLTFSQIHMGVAAEETNNSKNKTIRVKEGTNMSVAVSPDGKSLVIELQGGLWSLSGKGGEAKRISDNFDDPSVPDWSPDGSKIAYQSYRSGNYHIWTMNPDGSEKEQLTTGIYDHREPSYSPDGSRVAFSADRDGSYDIWVLDLKTEELTQWTDSPEEEFYPTWSPDGKEIAFVVGGDSNGKRIDVVNENNERRTITTVEDGKVLSPSWSPNGKDIAYVLQVDSRSELIIDGENVTGGEDVFPFPVKWTSGDEMIYTADGKIKQRNLNEQESRSIPFEAEIPIDQPEYNHKKYDFDSKKPMPVTGIVDPELSPDGKTIAFVALNDLWLLEVGKNKPKQLTNDSYFEANPAWSPDGTKLAYSSDKAGSEDIYILDVKTGNEQRLTSEAGAEVAASWSPDGKKIAFQDQEGATYIITIETGEIEQILKPMWEPGHPTWGPEGKTIAIAALKQFSNRFREGLSQILTVDLETGEQTYVDPAKSKSLSNRSNSGPVWSPDGKHMAFIIESTLWVMPVDQKGNPMGQARKITEEVAESPSWSGDSKTLLYVSNGELRTIQMNGDAPKKVPFKMTWKADQPNGITVIHAGKLWDGESKELKHNMDIIVQGNRIKEIKPHEKPHHGNNFIDASDQTVIPGLWDAHVHQALESAFLGSRQGRQLLSFGITSTVSMGEPAYLALEDREASASGARVAPRFFASGEPIDGSRVYYNFMRPTTSEDQLINLELKRAEELNYDILKTYVRMPFNYQTIAINYGHELGIPTFSHYFYPSIGFGQDGTSHVSATQRLGFSRSQSFTKLSYEDVTKLAAESGMAVTSTLFSSKTLLEFDPALLSDPRVKTLYTPYQYEAITKHYSNATTTDQTVTRTGLEREVSLLKDIMDAGGTILGGTDMPLDNVAVSLHLNIRAMVRYGMTPYEALRTVTYLPAKRFGAEDDLGTIESGKLADLVFVDGDPLQNIDDAANVQMVMKNGKVYLMDNLLEPYKNTDETN
ncbi:DPP IV N-terminal domain-containing protein [Sporosarcina aquimarina]|uniref:DPP IV N-terminal domain-containing protein n=1 Tax=Sporosarcina aquimarina TaxID=114975 RepID=UPI001C8D1ADF|nr:DPP IV N-terminal domain-containing protein [Sporosarcina aquimarina]MBY0221218.1 PD40 domain-containing protein [Sporosarcina aquimarina]